MSAADDVREAVARLSNHVFHGEYFKRTATVVEVSDLRLVLDALTAAEVRPRGTVTDTAEPYEYCVVNGLGRGIYMAKTLEEAREGIARDQRVGPGELRPKRSIVRRRRAGKWETFS